MWLKKGCLPMFFMMMTCLREHYAFKQYRVMEIYLHAFLSSAQAGRNWPASRHGGFIFGGNSPWYQVDRSLYGPQGRSRCYEENIVSCIYKRWPSKCNTYLYYYDNTISRYRVSCHCQESNRSSLVVQPAALRTTYRASSFISMHALSFNVS
jgi:hypothetical protein